ncbi:MAG: diguanylate cyclase [Methylococcales bacterium]|nr:diguanylate cyclase [Methylococcales bacterium]
MEIINNKKNPDKWKIKYFDLLDENEDIEKSCKEREELLCKTIIRLSFATIGVNKDLDPYLQKIRTQLKKGLKTEQLKSELESFSNALILMEEGEQENEQTISSQLFDFLVYNFPDHESALLDIKGNFATNDYTSKDSLFSAINEIINPEKQIELLTPSVTENDLEINSFENKSILSNLQLLLDTTDVPSELEPQAQALKEKIYGNASLSTVLDETISFIFQIKKHVQSEQKEITEFLTQLTDQLTELGIKTAGIHSSTVSTRKERNRLDESVSLQVKELQNSSKNATQLEPLKQLIKTRLASITQQIQEHQVKEKIDRNKVEKVEFELEKMTIKISMMEKESSELKNKLITANLKATHDPLTNIPNRLAYDNRLRVELARWKRYGGALSLVIWDIDYFKKINDKYGHKAGDKTLIFIAKLLTEHCRETDFVSRFGGEEFTMLLPNTEAKSALIAANKIRKIIEATAFNSNGRKISISISCGITQFLEADSEISAFNRADQALYTAKKNGRNQCVLI